VRSIVAGTPSSSNRTASVCSPNSGLANRSTLFSHSEMTSWSCSTVIGTLATAPDEVVRTTSLLDAVFVGAAGSVVAAEVVTADESDAARGHAVPEWR
jgi:hypothetical protein